MDRARVAGLPLSINIDPPPFNSHAGPAHSRPMLRKTPLLALSPHQRPRLSVSPDEHLARRGRQTAGLSTYPELNTQRNAFYFSLHSADLDQSPLKLRSMLPTSASAPVMARAPRPACSSSSLGGSPPAYGAARSGKLESVEPIGSVSLTQPGVGAISTSSPPSSHASSPGASPLRCLPQHLNGHSHTATCSRAAHPAAVTLENVWVRRAIDQKRVVAPAEGSSIERGGGGWSAAVEGPRVDMDYNVYPSAPMLSITEDADHNYGVGRNTSPSMRSPGSDPRPLHVIVTPSPMLPFGSDGVGRASPGPGAEFYSRRVLRLHGELKPSSEEAMPLSTSQQLLVRRAETATAFTGPPPSPEYKKLSASTSAPTLHRPALMALVSGSPDGPRPTPLHPLASSTVRRLAGVGSIGQSTLPTAAYRIGRIGGGFGAATDALTTASLKRHALLAQSSLDG